MGKNQAWKCLKRTSRNKKMNIPNIYKSIRKASRPKIDTQVKDKQVSEEEMQMANQHTIERPALLILNRMQIEIAEGYHFPYWINKDRTMMEDSETEYPVLFRSTVFLENDLSICIKSVGTCRCPLTQEFDFWKCISRRVSEMWDLIHTQDLHRKQLLYLNGPQCTEL